MKSMSILRRGAALLLALLLTAGTASAGLKGWPEQMTRGQAMAAGYFEQVNADLLALGQGQVNSIFECYSGFVSLGVTGAPDADVPENVEIVLTMRDTGLQVLTLHTCDMAGFPALAGACIEAAGQGTISLADAMKEPQAYADAVVKAPDNSITNHVDQTQGDTVRVYYNYIPNEYHDGRNWMTMTLVFPWGGAFAGVLVSPTPAPTIDYGTAFDGYSFDDGYTHLEVVTPVPPSPDDGVTW